MLRPIALAPLVLLVAAAACGPFRGPHPDPRPAKVPTGVGVFVKNYGGRCRSVLVGERIRTSCRERGGPSHTPKERPSSDTTSAKRPEPRR
jgi:hypothetical protein